MNVEPTGIQPHWRRYKKDSLAQLTLDLLKNERSWPSVKLSSGCKFEYEVLLADEELCNLYW